MSAANRDAVRGELTAICAGPAFARVQTLARLLTFLVEEELAGRGDLLRETYIGSSFFSRPPDYDPKVDSVVRVSATRLRTRLQQHYADANPLLRIVLQKGSYVPAYEQRTEEPVLAEPEGPACTLACDAPPPQLATVPASARWRWIATAAALLLALGALVLQRPKLKAEDKQGYWTLRPFARFAGSQEFADFSPDGKRVVFVSSDLHSETRNVYVEDRGSEMPRRLTVDPVEESRPVWSPDGSRIAFIKRDEHADRRSVMLLDPASGVQSRVATLRGSDAWLCQIARLSWTADGRSLISSGSNGEPLVPCGLVRVEVATGKVTPISSPPPETHGDLEAAVSPDGRHIAFLRTTSFATADIYVAGLHGEHPEQVTHDLRDILGFCWSPDSQSVLIASNRIDGQPRLWRVPLARPDKPQEMTDGVESPFFPAIARTGGAIAITQFNRVSDLYRQPTAPGAVVRAVQLTENESLNDVPAVSPNGRLAYRSTRTGSTDLWESDADGQGARLLVKGNAAMSPGRSAWSPDGKRLVFECRSAGVSNLCLIDADGSHLQRFTREAADQILPAWSHDGRSIYFASSVSGQYQIYRKGLDGGAAMTVTHGGGLRAQLSPDGHLLFVHRGKAGGGLIVLPVRLLDSRESGPRTAALAEAERHPILVDELPPEATGNWVPSATGILFLKPRKAASGARLFGYRLSDRTARPVGVLDATVQEEPANFALAPDGTALFFRKERSSTDIGLLQPHE